MMRVGPYTTCFGAIIDIEIESAKRAGMPVEKIMTELGQRWGQLFEAVLAKKRMEQNAQVMV